MSKDHPQYDPEALDAAMRISNHFITFGTLPKGHDMAEIITACYGPKLAKFRCAKAAEVFKDGWVCGCGHLHMTGTYCSRCNRYAPGVTPGSGEVALFKTAAAQEIPL